MRPWFWPLSVVPVAFGYFLATRAFPSPAEWPRLAAVMLVVGPLVWASVFAANDAFDLETDRLNPRKISAVRARAGLAQESLVRASVQVGALAVVGAWAFEGVLFAIGTLGVVTLGWIYSAPPVRLKSRPGGDVLVNAVVVGLVGLLGGWYLAADLADFPWLMGVQAVVVAAALYVPTTVLDLEADRLAGVRTTAVRLGPRRTYVVGLALWVLAVLGPVALAMADYVFPRSLLVAQMLTSPVLVTLYAVLMRRPSIARLALVCVALALCFLRFTVELAS